MYNFYTIQTEIYIYFYTHNILFDKNFKYVIHNFMSTFKLQKI